MRRRFVHLNKSPAGKLRSSNDGSAPLIGNSIGHVSKEARALNAEAARQVRLESDHKRKPADRNAIECVNEIKTPWRKRIENRYSLNLVRDVVQRQKIP